LLNGGCDFAVDPQLRSDQATVVWNAQSDPRMAIFTAMPPDLCDAPALALANPSVLATSAEGSYLALLALPPTRRALLLGEAAAGAVALVLPLDRLFEDRIDTARRFHRLLVSGRATPSTFTAYRRRRLRLALRALDGTLNGADYRAVAEVLFGDRVPRGAAWRDDSLRGQIIRLVRYGLDLMQGGYLDLLRPERRQPKGRRRP
jgi:hypothetical protein